MKLERLYLAAFGRFQDKEITLDNGINLLYGLNETGKSTVRHFIEGMLYGLKKPNVRRKIFADEFYRYRPWSGERYAGELDLTHDGVPYRIVRNFANDEMMIFQRTTGEEITSRYELDATNERNFIESATGMGKILFVNTLSMGQIRSGSERDLAEEVGRRLKNMRVAGISEISVEDALHRLEACAAQLEAGEGGYLPANALQEQLAAVQRDMENARETANVIAGKESERTALREQIEMMRMRVNRAKEYAQAAALKSAVNRLRDIQALDFRLRALDERIGPLSRYRQFPLDVKQEVEGLRQVFQEVCAETDRMEENWKRLKKEWMQAEEALRALEPYNQQNDQDVIRAFRDFRVYENTRNEKEIYAQRIKEAVEKIQSLDTWLERRLAFASYSGDPVADVKRIESELQSQTRQEHAAMLAANRDRQENTQNLLKRYSWNVWFWLLAIVVGTGFALTMHAAFFIVTAASMAGAGYTLWRMIVLGNELENLREQRTALEAEAGAWSRRTEELLAQRESILFTLGAESLFDLVASYTEFKQKVAARDELSAALKQWKAAYDRLQQEQDACYERLSATLVPLGLIEPGEAIGTEHMDRFHEMAYRAAKSKEHCNRLASEVQKLEEAVRIGRMRQLALEDDLRSLLHDHGFAGLEEFEQRYQQYETCMALLEERAQLQEELQKKLGTDSLEQLAEAVHQLSGGIEAAAAEQWAEERLHHGDPVNIGDLQQMEEELQRMFLQEKTLEQEIRALQASLKPWAAWEDRKAWLEKQLAETAVQKNALEMARNAIQEVCSEMPREFAPYLRTMVGRYVSTITGDRYTDIQIGNDLKISVILPDTGSRIEFEHLSGGTIDQIYFSVRLAIGDYLSRSPSLPFILDDSFVFFDRERLERMMVLLGRISRERQILLFTCHDREKQCMESQGIPFHYVELA